jgi:hypothetical protein
MKKSTSPLRLEISRAARARQLNWQAIEQTRRLKKSKKRASKSGHARLEPDSASETPRPTSDADSAE